MPHLYQNLSYNDNCKYTNRKKIKNAFSYIKYFFLLLIITATASVSITLSNPNTAAAIEIPTELQVWERMGYDDKIAELRAEYKKAVDAYAEAVGNGTTSPEKLAEINDIQARLDAEEIPAKQRMMQWDSAKLDAIDKLIAENKDPDVIAAKAAAAKAAQAIVDAGGPGANPDLVAAAVTANQAVEDAINGIDTKAAKALADAEAAEAKTNATKTCGIGGVGWILCPVLSFGSQMADKMFDMFSGFLQTSPTIFTFKDANGGNTVFTAWSAMRNIANVLFVIVFLIVIFSQVTGTGITNYGIKKILPKLVVAAILVNLSYYICQIAVDLSNILGFSLQGFIQGLIPAGSIGTQESFGLFDIFEGTALVVAGGAILWASLAALIPAILAAIVGLLMILFILIARQAIIIILIIISPLAFIAFMLPNTEKLFKKWLDTLKSMLLLFPIIAVVFGTSKLASGVLQAVFNQNQNPDFLNVGKIASAAILILPLFVVPSLLKGALDGIGKLGAKINGIGDKWSKGASDKTKGSRAIQNLEALKANRKLRRDNMAINGTGNRFQRVIGTPRRSLMQTQARLAAIKQSQESEAKRATSEYLAKDISAPDSRLLQQMSAGGSAGVADRSKASAISILEKMKAEEVSAQTALIKNLDQATIQTLSMGGSVTNPNTGITYNASNNIALRTAAMKKTIDESDIHGINNLIDQASSGGMNIDTMQSFADVLSTSSGRPSYVGAGAIAQIRQGSTKNSTDLAISAINNNTYSPDKLASASKDELALISSIARNDNTAPIGIGGVDINITRATPGSAPVDTTLIKASAEKAATEAVYAGRIAKQRGQIEDLRNL